MSTIRILDDLNAPLLDVEPQARSGLGRYLPDRVLTLLALRPAAAALQKRLSEAPTDPAALEFSLVDGAEIGGAGGLVLDAASRAAVGVHQPDELLFPADDLRDAVAVPSGTAFVSIALAPRVRAGLAGDRGALAFGFGAGASLSVRYCHPFDAAAVDPSVATALGDALRAAVIPADLDDLAALPAGAHASVEGEGELRLAASVELAGVANPLATPGLPIVGSAGVSAGASVGVGAEWRASGAFELRVSKVAEGRVRLSYYRRAGSQVAVEASAALGVSASIRESDVIQRLLAAISSDPRADLERLVAAGLADAQIEALQHAVARSVDRSLRLATELQFSAVRRGEALFAYDIDLAALSEGGRAAVAEALRGRLTAIADAAAADGPIRAVQTGMLARRERRVAWRVNLFGILNVRSVSDLLRQGSVSYDPVTGTLNVADEISSERILVRTRPLEADGEKVRQLAFESTIVTAAYQASRAMASVSLRCAASYFEERRRTSAADLRADFNAITGLGLADAAEADRRLAAEHDFGPSTFLAECVFDRDASDALFIGPDGPFTVEHYERVGRNALLALIPAGDTERAHRRVAVGQDAAWAALKAAGPAAARFDLARRLGEIRAEHIIGDYVVIRWWSDAMAAAARALVEMRQFLAGRTADSLAGDADFQKRRARLERELADVVRESKARFGDPWGLVALDGAAGRAAAAQATIVSPRLTVTYTDRVVPRRAAVRAARAVSRDMFAPREAKRPFSADEKELLRRHAVNLRLGALSTEGEFQTTDADVRRLFGELLPQELEMRKASGQKLRLIFYAHGGLIEEREGLEPVLKRLKFWRRNGVYPISFVWETGLRETVADIVRGLAGARDMVARGAGEDLADAFLEFAARQPGRQVWSQMKRSAELSVLDGGGALLVAETVRDFWNAHHADMEIHAAGHSAGAIFQSHFLPSLVSRPVAAGVPPIHVRTLHLLAPACTTALFRSKLAPLAGHAVGAMTMYTMAKSLELEDRAGPYRKSLLYLVSRAFETEQPTPILGLEESLRDEVALIRFFGLAGTRKEADLLFSKTPPNAPPRERSLSTSHGGFDDDVATMSSLMRRVLDVPDTTSIVDFFQDELPPIAGEPGDAGAAVAEAIERASGTRPALPPAMPAMPQPPATPAAAGARRALCVGIDGYGPGYELAGCVNDARNWAGTLAALRFEVTALHDQAASRSAILSALTALVAGARPGDVIVFQFAGHGTQVDDVDGDETDSRDEAFCPVDFADGRLLIDDDIRAVVAELQPGVNLTCFIDCCHSGTITRAIVPGGRPPRAPAGSRARYIPYSKKISDLHRRFRQGAEGRARSLSRGPASEMTLKEVCFSACQPHEVAFETGGSGQFTARAVGVLQSAGDLTNAGFLERVVAAFGSDAPQHPYLDCPEEARTRRLLAPIAVDAPVEHT